ncbi:MAG TPA: HAD family hydrolase [Thermoanaerobaculia bacterium]|nr:HAD family hydrolase [Thermoanaerobaculia bacterium]
MLDMIAFDADDTLWHNESVFQATEKQFVELLSSYHAAPRVSERLLATETRNLHHFGYGVKGFTLSMIETAIELSEGSIRAAEIERIIKWGHEMLRAPVQLLEGVRETVESLSGEYRLMLLTKGDLFDQESKLARSGLGDFFNDVQIVSEKDPPTYRRVIARVGVSPERFLMVGNSLKSDILPALEAGARAVHIPYETTWAHERVHHDHGRQVVQLSAITELPAWLASSATARD